MRIVLDLQACQTESRFRGIGRYSLSLAEAIVRQASSHEVRVVLNGEFHESAPDIIKYFSTLLPSDHFHFFNSPGPIAEIEDANLWRSRAGEIVREKLIESLKPDIVHVSSLFEGLGTNGIASCGLLGGGERTSVTLYDLIPYTSPDIYLRDQRVSAWYFRKIESLRKAGLLLAISEYSRLEAINALRLRPESVVNISSAVDSNFRPLKLTNEQADQVRNRCGLKRSFIMYTGGIDHRKNIEGLIKAFSLIPGEMRSKYQLAIVCNVQRDDRMRISKLVTNLGLSEEDIVLTGFVSESDLISLYNLTALFVFPSWHEGFGLPALEAMACGAPTIGSNRTSLPEVIGNADALFDPLDPENIAKKIYETLKDSNLQERLRAHGLAQAQKFSWDQSAQRALKAFEVQHEKLSLTTKSTISKSTQRSRLAILMFPTGDNQNGNIGRAKTITELSCYYNVEVISDRPNLINTLLDNAFEVRDFLWFENNQFKYDRIIYCLDSFKLLPDIVELYEKYPGVISLRNSFFEGNEAEDLTDEKWLRFFYKASGCAVLQDRTSLNYQSAVQEISKWLESASEISGLIVENSKAFEVLKNSLTQLNINESPVFKETGEHLLVDQVGPKLYSAIEKLYADRPLGIDQSLVFHIGSINEPVKPTENDLISLSKSLAKIWPTKRRPTVFLDMTQILNHKTIAEAKVITSEFFKRLSSDIVNKYRFQIVCEQNGVFMIAHSAVCALFDIKCGLIDESAEIINGDILLNVTLGPQNNELSDQLAKLKGDGIKVENMEWERFAEGSLKNIFAQNLKLA